MSGKDLSAWSGIEGHILPAPPSGFQGRFLPVYENEWIHMLHRLIAIIGGLTLVIMAWIWLKNKYGYNATGLSIIVLILLEICVGVLNAVYRVPAPISRILPESIFLEIMFLNISCRGFFSLVDNFLSE